MFSASRRCCDGGSKEHVPVALRSPHVKRGRILDGQLIGGGDQKHFIGSGIGDIYSTNDLWKVIFTYSFQLSFGARAGPRYSSSGVLVRFRVGDLCRY